MVSKLVPAIGRLRTDANGDESRDRRGEIDNALESIRVEGDTAGRPIGEIFDAHDDGRHGDVRRSHPRNIVAPLHHA